ncbi:molybdopterin-dependent oxidoreductase [Methanospirillum sp.]|uniref:molybdopterin-dependent oxidoreductase n=1 Tax=Methanospirillum sp. TaxID=45200 RepID=UPI002CF75F25|nr:molybdopterin-dependent oxidoreductase [Methanospirillum sp.]HPP78478.1 molybdopterin-dependent oxidoreductase [Methanospirillum sp.]
MNGRPVIFFLLIVGIGGFWLYTLLEPGSVSLDSSPTLPSVEIRNYEGEDLSSFHDFRENSIKGPQIIQRDNYRLEVSGLVNRTISFSYQDIIEKFPSYKKVVKLNCVEGWDVIILWEGILVRDLIRYAGVKPTANTIIFYAYDGYSTSFPLSYVMDNPIMMAYRMNNLTLPIERGFPFQLVAEDKWGYKWIKWITRIEISDNDKYRGYWESRGFSQDGDLNKGFFD